MRYIAFIVLSVSVFAQSRIIEPLIIRYANPEMGTTLNGSSQYWFTPNSTSLGFGTADYTVNAVIKYSTTPGSNYRIVDKFNGSTAGILLFVNSSNYIVAQYTVGGANVIVSQSSGATLNDNKPHLVTASNTRGDSVRLYVDGSRVAVGAASVAGSVSVTDSLAIGASLDIPAGRNFNGTIGQVQIIGGALSADQVAVAYSRWNSTMVLPTSYGTFPTLFNVDWKNFGNDKSGNANNLTSAGGPTISRIR